MALFGTMSKVFKGAPKLKKRRFDPEKMSVEDIQLPRVFNIVFSEDIPDMIKEEVSTYKSMGYVNKPLDQLKDKEYHSYQIGIILKFLQEDKVFFLPDADKILNSAATVLTKRSLHIKVFDIVALYNEQVPKDALKQELMDDYRWSPLDMTYLLRYASLENRTIPKPKD